MKKRMLLSEILHEIDTEIERLTRARDILATLNLPAHTSRLNTPTGPDITPDTAKLPPIGQHTAAEAVDVSERPDASVPLTVLPPSRRRGPRAHRPRNASQEERAIGGIIPEGPVVVSAQQVARYQAEKVQAAAAARPAISSPPQDGTLDALLRQLSSPLLDA